MTSHKELLRKRLKLVRQNLSEEEVLLSSDKVAIKFINKITLDNISSICCYQAIKALKEVSPSPLLTEIKKVRPNISIYFLPKTKSVEIPKQDFDIIIVPCLGFSESRYRLGWGGGFYDKFLAAQPNALKVGLAYSDSLINFNPEPHDIPLDIIVTEYNCYA